MKESQSLSEPDSALRCWRGKSELCRLYRIDKKTLNKWVARFCQHIVDPLEFKCRRKIPGELFQRLVQTLGEPKQDKGAFRKKDIVESAGSSYSVVRAFVGVFSERLLLTREDYDHLSTLPPSVAQRLLHALEEGCR